MEVSIIKKKQKNLYLRIKNGKVICTAPLKCSDKYINDFINSKQEWITSRLNEISNRVLLDRDFSFEDYKIAYELFDNLTKEYLSFYKEEPARILIKDLKSKWGSCNKRRRVINYNIRLLDLDEDVIRYIVVHEVAHLRYADHSKNFYDHVMDALPNYNIISKKLKNYNLK